MSIFTLRRKPTILKAPETKPDPVLMRFLTHGGATVIVTSSAERYYATCRGCGWTNYGDITERCARDNANTHADECRSMPKRGVAR